MKEVWKDIPKYEGYYMVSNKGRIKSLQRTIIDSLGRIQTIKECIRKPQDNKRTLEIMLSKDGKRKCFVISILVLFVFKNIKRNKSKTKFKNGDYKDCSLKNIKYYNKK